MRQAQKANTRLVAEGEVERKHLINSNKIEFVSLRTIFRYHEDCSDSFNEQDLRDERNFSKLTDCKSIFLVK